MQPTPPPGARLLVVDGELCWRAPTRGELIRDGLYQYLISPFFRAIVWPVFVLLYHAVRGYPPQEPYPMNLSITTSGDRPTVLKYLAGLMSDTAPPSEQLPASPPAQNGATQPERETIARKAIAQTLADYVNGAPEGADHFSMSASVYVGYQVPTPEASTTVGAGG